MIGPREHYATRVQFKCKTPDCDGCREFNRVREMVEARALPPLPSTAEEVLATTHDEFNAAADQYMNLAAAFLKHAMHLCAMVATTDDGCDLDGTLRGWKVVLAEAFKASPWLAEVMRADIEAQMRGVVRRAIVKPGGMN